MLCCPLAQGDMEVMVVGIIGWPCGLGEIEERFADNGGGAHIRGNTI